MRFRTFSAEHLAALGVILILALLIIRAGKRWPASRLGALGKLMSLSLIAYACAAYVQMGTAHYLGWGNALPLELCHWVLIACMVSLIWPNQLASEIAYFWGLAGTLQATLTPEIYTGFPSWEFILYFWSHGGILLAIVFIIAAQGFRPRPGSMLRMFGAVNLYALVAGSANIIFGWNYGYLCRKPLEPSLMDYLGPWPWYLISLECIALVSFWLLDLPWRIHRRWKTEVPRAPKGPSI